MIELPGGEHTARLEEKAKSLIGVWIEDKTDPDFSNADILYPYDYMRFDNDVILMCYSIPIGDLSAGSEIKDVDVYMSEYSEFYRKSRRSGKKAWLKARAFYDKVFGV